jgi:hypothetical protein
VGDQQLKEDTVPKKLKLSAGRPRTELIASHAYGQAAEMDLTAPAPPTPPAEEKPAPEKPAPEKTDTDSAVDVQIKALGDVIDAMKTAGNADPDELAKLEAAYEALVKAQAADDATEKAEPATDPDKPPVTAAGPVAAPATPAASVEPAEPLPGDVGDDQACVTCQHLASAHEDMDAGKNMGACMMLNCDCPAMKADTATAPTNDDDGSMASAPVNVTPDAPVPPTAAPGVASGDTPPEQNLPPATPGGVSMGPAFTIPVAIIEGQPTGDGRQIAPNALDWRVPPLPLMGLSTSTHDPMGMDMNDPAVIIGRIDSFTRVPGQGATQIIEARGYLLANDDGMYFADIIEGMGRVGVSADVAVEEVDLQVGEVDDMGFPTEMSEMLTKGTIMGLTVCPYPAFEGAYIVLGDGTEQPDPIPQTDAEPAMTASAPIHWMTYQQCELCDQGLETVVASGQGPVAPPKAWFSNPNFEPDDGRLLEILDKRGKRVIGGKYACPITVTDQGRVFGHIAPWGVCHTGNSGQCILAPHSKVDYAHFKRGQHIITAEGDQVRVGVLTADTGHADIRSGAASAMAHYDNTALAVADVNIGEDEHGIWVAGAIRPDAAPEQIRKLRAASISGDWRQLGGTLELVAALAVNQPGFPLAVVAGGHHEALVAAGGSVMARLKDPAVPADDSPGVQALRAVRSREQLKQFTRDTQDRARAVVAALQ